MLCEPHLRRGLSIQADVTVSGEAMCNSCFAGHAVSLDELAGEIGDSVTREAQRSYYDRNRERVLATHRKWRESRKVTIAAAPETA